VREKAAWSLGIRGTDETVEPLIVALADSDADIRTQAAWALGITGDSRAVEPLNAALEDESGSVREQAAWALGVLGDARAVEPLIAALTDTNPEVRKQAAWALGIIGDPRAGDALRDLSNRNGESKAAKAAALEALDHVGAANVPIEGTRTLTAESSALSGQKLLLETERGSFRIRATDTDRVHVETTFTCYQGRIPCDRLLASLTLSFRQSGDEIELTIEGPSKKNERKSARRQLAAQTAITVPSSLPLAIRVKVGEVDIELPQKAVSRIELLSDMGRPELEGQDIRSETRYSDRGDHGHEVEWSGGSGGADITIEVGVGSISARLTG
jgi:hypothetical protein